MKTNWTEWIGAGVVAALLGGVSGLYVYLLMMSFGLIYWAWNFDWYQWIQK